MLGYFVGRFSLSTGVNFNRDFLNLTERVFLRISAANSAAESNPEDVLSLVDEKHNVRVVRRAISSELEALQSQPHRFEKEEAALKRVLYAKAAVADIVLDLHCDCEAVMHMYTHDRLWPKMSDLASEIGAHCSLLAPYSGGDPFDEACSCLWASMQDKFPAHPLPMACEAVTIELRGESDVYDHFAEGDAHSLVRFLVGRGYLSSAVLALVQRDSGSGVVPKALPLSGVDMIEASVCGVLAWRVKAGDVVTEGQLLGEIVNIEDPDAARVPITTRTAGIVFGVRRHKLARPGEICIKVAGDVPLPWRTGHLLTSR